MGEQRRNDIVEAGNLGDAGLLGKLIEDTDPATALLESLVDGVDPEWFELFTSAYRGLVAIGQPRERLDGVRQSHHNLPPTADVGALAQFRCHRRTPPLSAAFPVELLLQLVEGCGNFPEGSEVLEPHAHVDSACGERDVVAAGAFH